MTATSARPLQLLARRPIHPWLHVDAEGVIIGRVTDIGDIQLVTSDRTAHDPGDMKDLLAFVPRVYPDLANRWPDADAEDWLTNGSAPTFAEAFVPLHSELEAAVQFAGPHDATFVAVWGLATYFHQLFLTFPRLNLVGERGCGKSKVLGILHAVAWNAYLSLVPTSAVLYRLIQETRPTLLLDECEGLSGNESRDILAIINSGYKRGGVVLRCEGERINRVEPFQVYSPLALAGINGLNATTEDRAIRIVMQRGTMRDRINAEVDSAAPVFTRIRSIAYRLLLTRWRDVVKAYNSVSFPEWLNGRARELWKPLLAIAQIVEEEGGQAVMQGLLAMAQEHVEDRSDLSAEGEALLEILEGRFGPEDAILVRPGDLSDELQQRLGWRDKPTPERVGSWLRRLGFRRTKKAREGAQYEIRAEQLREAMRRYGLDTTVTPSPSHSN